MFTKEDELKFRAFKSVIEKGKFEVEGKAVITVAALLQWFYSLENKIKAPLVPKEQKAKRKVLDGNVGPG